MPTNIFNNISLREKQLVLNYKFAWLYFHFFVVSRKPRRYLKTFLDPVASLSFNMGQWRATATSFIPETINCNVPDMSNMSKHVQTCQILSWSMWVARQNPRRYLGIRAIQSHYPWRSVCDPWPPVESTFSRYLEENNDFQKKSFLIFIKNS